MPSDIEQTLLSTPGLGGYRFDPLALIRSVNILQPLGKEGALDAIAKFLKAHPAKSDFDVGAGGMPLLLRCLFEVPMPPGYFPSIEAGAPLPPEPQDATRVPRFPLVVLEDIPLVLVNGWAAAGSAQAVVPRLDYFRSQCRLRARPLAPTDRPLDVLARLEKSPQWLWGRRYKTNQGELWAANAWQIERGQQLIRNQLLRLIRDVSAIPTDEESLSRLWEGGRAEANWQRIAREVSRLNFRWNAGRQTYSRK